LENNINSNNFLEVLIEWGQIDPKATGGLIKLLIFIYFYRHFQLIALLRVCPSGSHCSHQTNFQQQQTAVFNNHALMNQLVCVSPNGDQTDE